MSFGLMLVGNLLLGYFLVGGESKTIFGTSLALDFLGGFELDSHRDFGRTLFLMGLRCQYFFKSASLSSVLEALLGFAVDGPHIQST